MLSGKRAIYEYQYLDFKRKQEHLLTLINDHIKVSQRFCSLSVLFVLLTRRCYLGRVEECVVLGIRVVGACGNEDNIRSAKRD